MPEMYREKTGGITIPGCGRWNGRMRSEKQLMNTGRDEKDHSWGGAYELRKDNSRSNSNKHLLCGFGLWNKRFFLSSPN
ncbi:hypothetical protein CEXT_250091 [Caerostris extrusa]|uniref:Uncharacterized protein n=1 Tax=Caerostris extrusa TaxID=172846 RepID=A0AAV4X662_CAEEX|nr:hypothetical protein CEXT_250091 [Caerostris extrusa]